MKEAVKCRMAPTEFWKRLKIRVFGKLCQEYKGRYVFEAYLYKGVYYITRYRSIFL